MTPAGGSRDDPPGDAAVRPAPPPRRADAGAAPAPEPPDLPELRESPLGSDDGDAGLEAMRSVWLSMRDEEPSDRGMAALLAAARTQAEAMRPRPTRWQLLLAALRRPAMLALASALVLVGIGVLIGRRSADAPARSPAVNHSPGAAPEAGTGSTSAPVVMPPASAPAVMPPAPAPAVPEPQPTRSRAAAPVHHDADDPYSSAESAPPPPPARPTAPRRTAPAMPASGGDATRLYQQCLAAARRGDCAAARALVDQIQQTDPRSLGRVARDPAVARCLSE